jgi:hypothetical protein
LVTQERRCAAAADRGSRLADLVLSNLDAFARD